MERCCNLSDCLSSCLNSGRGHLKFIFLLNMMLWPHAGQICAIAAELWVVIVRSQCDHWDHSFDISSLNCKLNYECWKRGLLLILGYSVIYGTVWLMAWLTHWQNNWSSDWLILTRCLRVRWMLLSAGTPSCLSRLWKKKSDFYRRHPGDQSKHRLDSNSSHFKSYTVISASNTAHCRVTLWSQLATLFIELHCDHS